MPKLKKRSALQTLQLDRARKHTLSKCDSPGPSSDTIGTTQDAEITVNHALIDNPQPSAPDQNVQCVLPGLSSATVGTTQDAEVNVNHFLTDHQQPSALDQNIVQIIGTHEYSFHDVQPNDVLQGELHIQTMDYISQTLKVQFNCQFGMLPPSYVYQLHTSNSVGNFQRIPCEVDAVQIHFVQNHFIVSAQINRQIYVYDSLLNRSHVHTVKGQLQLVYESSCEPVLLSPQSQGSTLLCGLFAVANAFTLLQKKDPSKMHFLTDKMRMHLHKCLMAGKIDAFPHIQLAGKRQSVLDTISAYFLDQKKRQTAKQSCKNVEQQEADLNALPRKTRHTIMRTNKRTNKAYKDKERIRETKTRKLKRNLESYKRAEILRETFGRKIKRLNKAYKRAEIQRETLQRLFKRSDKSYKDAEILRESFARKLKRLNHFYKQVQNQTETLAENKRETKQRKIKRQQQAYRLSQNMRETYHRKKKDFKKPIEWQKMIEKHTKEK